MEIERKFLIKHLPENLESYECHHLIQGYLCTAPVLRVRKDNDDYIVTYKGSGKMAREEFNEPLNEEAFNSLIKKCDGVVISKKRYVIPSQTKGLFVELDVFDEPYKGLIIAEVEFESVEQANAYVPEDYFGEDVTEDGRYHNSYLSKQIREL